MTGAEIPGVGGELEKEISATPWGVPGLGAGLRAFRRGGSKVHVTLWKRNLNLGGSKSAFDLETQIRRYPPILARIGDPNQQGEVQAGVAEMFESDLRRGFGQNLRM